MFFFFQAEDGIRDLTVTGVQTCALPICPSSSAREAGRWAPEVMASSAAWGPARRAKRCVPPAPGVNQIGRGSCRERGEISVVAVSLKKKQYIHLTHQ